MLSICSAWCISVSRRYNLVVLHNHLPLKHWRNRILGWLYPIVSCIVLFVLQCFEAGVVGDCNRVW